MAARGRVTAANTALELAAKTWTYGGGVLVARGAWQKEPISLRHLRLTRTNRATPRHQRSSKSDAGEAIIKWGGSGFALRRRLTWFWTRNRRVWPCGQSGQRVLACVRPFS